MREESLTGASKPGPIHFEKAACTRPSRLVDGMTGNMQINRGGSKSLETNYSDFSVVATHCPDRSHCQLRDVIIKLFLTVTLHRASRGKKAMLA